MKFRRSLLSLNWFLALFLAGWMALAVSPVPAVSGPVIVGQIEILGVTALTQAEVESLLEVEDGDQLERSKVVRSAQNIRDFYQSRGYPEVSVESSIVRREGESNPVLVFTVHERLPIRIGEIELSLLSTEGAIRSDWARLQFDLLRRLDLSTGDILDQDRVSQGARALESVLAQNEYVGASVADIRIRNTDQIPEAGKNLKASRWVSLQIVLDPGERITFGFRGNEFLSTETLLSVLSEQRVLGFGKNYLTTVRTRIEDEYKKAGFSAVKVTSFPVEQPTRRERHITFVIDEGPRVELDGVDFDGNTEFSTETLRQVFRSNMSPLLRKGIYVDRDLDRTTEVFIQALKAKGYLSAKVVSVNRTFNADRSHVRVSIFLQEGEQTRFGTLSMKGVTLFSHTDVASMLGVKEGEPFNLFSFAEGFESLKASYRSRGYLDAQITTEGSDRLVVYSDENRRADLNLEVLEGFQYRVSQIVIEGRGKTRDWVILREVPFQEGDLLTADLLAEAEARIRRLALFSVVSVKAVEDLDRRGYKIVRITLQEGTPGVIAGGLGLRSDLGLRGFMQTSYSNLWGRSHAIVLGVAANRRFVRRRVPFEFQSQLGYIWPWFGLRELTFRPSLTLERMQYVTFDANSAALNLTWERRILRKPHLVGSFNYHWERTEQHADDPIDNQTLRIGSITPSVRLDLRDDPLSPTRGFYAWTAFEWADPALFSQVEPFPVGFTRFQFRADYLVPVGPQVSWFLSFRTGIERNTQDPTKDSRIAIPLIKQFALGGAGSLRGFREQELNLQSLAIRGTASYVNYRTQLDLPFAGSLRFGPFLDVANLLVDEYSLDKNLRFGTGMGFHYQTPVGPINFDMGFKINPLPGEDPYRFYFSIGVI